MTKQQRATILKLVEELNELAAELMKNVNKDCSTSYIKDRILQEIGDVEKRMRRVKDVFRQKDNSPGS